MSRFIKGRENLLEDLKKQIPQDKTVFWFHCASLGEYEQGRPLIERIRLLYPDFFVLLTFYSPSGYDVVKNENNAHYVSYIPFDFKKQVKTFLDIVQPEIAVFVKYEFWPVLMNQLNKREVKVYLVAGIFRANQIFFKPYGAFMRNALQAFDHFFVQDVHSEKLLKKINIDAVTTVGDSRFDRVLEIKEKKTKLDFMDAFVSNASCVLVAGSTWSKDHDCLLSFINSHLTPGQKVLIAPHEFTSSSLADLCDKISLKTTLYSNYSMQELADTQVFILDTFGLLTKVYAYADIAYVGGGLGSGGVHNVLEPAVFGVPVVMGPVHEKYIEAVALKSREGALVIENENTFNETMVELFQHKDYREKIGQLASQYVIHQSGATEKILSFLKKQIN